MSKKNIIASLLLVIFLATSICLPLVFSAEGAIRVNSKNVSPTNQQVQAGGSVNLYFGQITWSGTHIYLLLSNDNVHQISTGDTIYTPKFSLSDLKNPTSTVYNNDNGAWSVGDNWVNGTITQNVPVGNYYVKAFDEVSATVAVTDTSIRVYSVVYSATLQSSPSSGAGGITASFTGSNYPPLVPVTIAYYDPAFGTWNYLLTTVADSKGKIEFTTQIPDLRESLGSGDYSESYTPVSYRAEINGVVYCYYDYNEYARGLKRVGNQIANGLYGNGTNLASTVNIKTGDNLFISGKYFHPGAIYIRWDGSDVTGTVTADQWRNAEIIGTSAANQAGYFETSVIIPQASAGEHYLSIEDSQTKVIIKVYVSLATLSISPSSGPGGITVQFTGSGYKPSAPVTISHHDPKFNTWNVLDTTSADASGNLQFDTKVPDLRESTQGYDIAELFTAISFRTEQQGTVYSYADYNEYARGLKRVGNQIANGLYGNGTNLASTVNIKTGDNLFISGKYFHPGVVYIRWDGFSVVGTVTGDQWRNAEIIGNIVANSEGYFETSVIIPQASAGEHYLSIEDSQTKVIIKVAVGQTSGTPTPTPTATPRPELDAVMDLSCKSTTSYIGYKVEVNGKLTSNLTPLVSEPILLSYSVTGGSSWENLTFIYTDANGEFSAVWMPQASGNYLIKAVWGGNIAFNEVSKTVSFASAPYAQQNVFSVTSNSTVSALAFNSVNNELCFTVTGPTETTGFVDVGVAKDLILDVNNMQIYLDDITLDYTTTATNDSWFIHFDYTHSTHEVVLKMGEIATPTTNPTYTPTPITSEPTMPPTQTPTQEPIITASPDPTVMPSPTVPEFPAATLLVIVTLTSAAILVAAKRYPESELNSNVPNQ